MKPLRDLLSFCIFTVNQIEAFCTAVLVEAYEPRTDDGLGIPGVHALPEKGYVSGGLGVHDEQLHEVYEDMEKDYERVYEDMAKELRQIYKDFKAKYTSILWGLYKKYHHRLSRLRELEKRICETCGRTFMGNDERECLVCRGKGE